MTITIVNSTDLSTPFQCPVCMGLFYFEQDYTKHKCKRKREAPKFYKYWGGK